MFEYFKGNVTKVKDSHIILEVSNIGYKIHVHNPNSYEHDSKIILYIYQKITENKTELYGFGTPSNKELFLTFLKVKGVGPSIAFNLAHCDKNKMSLALGNKDVNYLCTFKKVGIKLAHQIILELGTLDFSETSITDRNVDEIYAILSSMGNEDKIIKEFLNIHLNLSHTKEDVIKEFYVYKKRDHQR